MKTKRFIEIPTLWGVHVWILSHRPMFNHVWSFSYGVAYSMFDLIVKHALVSSYQIQYRWHVRVFLWHPFVADTLTKLACTDFILLSITSTYNFLSHHMQIIIEVSLTHQAQMVSLWDSLWWGDIGSDANDAYHDAPNCWWWFSLWTRCVVNMAKPHWETNSFPYEHKAVHLLIQSHVILSDIGNDKGWWWNDMRVKLAKLSAKNRCHRKIRTDSSDK